jgi:N-acyl-D-aspartate/D-glutamate deacylase
MFEIQMSAPFPFERLASFGPVSAADRAGKARLYADPAFRAAARRELDPATPASEPARNFREAFAGMRVSDCAEDRGLNGRAVAELAAARGVHPFDLVLDLSLASGMATRFHFPLANTDEDGVAELLRLPHTVLGLSDAGAHASQICDACFSTHLLGHWVRDKAALSLEQAIDHLCARPARTFGIAGRGRLAPGWAADIVVFDPATVAPGPLERVRDLPGGADRLIARPAGIDAVIVNGAVLRRGGEDRVDPAGPLPGRLLRRGRA